MSGLRRRLRRGCATSLLGLGLLAGCDPAPPPQRASLSVFGGKAEIELRGQAPARLALDEIAARFRAMDQEWHAFEPGPLTALNAAIARGESAPAPESIRDLIRRSQALSIQSDGLFDPAVGGLMQLWGFHSTVFPITEPLPTRAQIEAWRSGQPSIADVSIDGERVSSRNPAVQLDFGGISEGVAAEEATRILARHGLRDALLDLGGDYYALGDAGGRPWQVQVRDPYGGSLADVALADGEALFTSGNFNKFRAAPSGARWAHVLDPRTGQPVLNSAAVAVLHRDPVLADVAATTLMVGGVARFAELVGRLGIRCALLVTEENEMVLTAAMESRLQLRREPVRLGPPIPPQGSCSP